MAKLVKRNLNGFSLPSAEVLVTKVTVRQKFRSVFVTAGHRTVPETLPTDEQGGEAVTDECNDCNSVEYHSSHNSPSEQQIQ